MMKTNLCIFCNTASNSSIWRNISCSRSRRRRRSICRRNPRYRIRRTSPFLPAPEQRRSPATRQELSTTNQQLVIIKIFVWRHSYTLEIFYLQSEQPFFYLIFSTLTTSVGGGGEAAITCATNGAPTLSGESTNKHILEDRLNVGRVYGNKYSWYSQEQLSSSELSLQCLVPSQTKRSSIQMSVASVSLQ